MSTLIKTFTSLMMCALLACSTYAQQLRASTAFSINNSGRVSGNASTQAETSQPFFDFHSNFWINLHHFLYQEALKQKRAQKGTNKSSDSVAANGSKAADFSAEQQRLWQSALDYYQKNIIARDLLFDQELGDIEYHLADSESASSLKTSGIKPELVTVLESAAPVYRAKWWKEHDRANHNWIAAVTPMVEKYGKSLTTQLASAYKTVWPSERVRVDVSVYANWAGAYTMLLPTLITISSVGEANQGFAAIEILFHESSHALVRPLQKALAEKFISQKKPVPRDMWHALLFYTTGEIVRRTLYADNVKNYVPYAYAHGLYQGAWGKYRQAFEREWQPYLDGKTDFDTALTRLVTSL